MRTCLVAVAAAVLSECAVALGASPPAVPPKFVVTQVRGSLTRSKDTHPISARFVLTRRQDANELLDGASVNSNQLVYAVVVEGRFTVSRPGPNAQGMMHVPVLFYIIDARTGRETDGGFRGTMPALSKLGTVYNLAPYLQRR